MSPLFGRPKDDDEADPGVTTFPDAPTYGARPEAPQPASGDSGALSDEDLDAASAEGAAAVGTGVTPTGEPAAEESPAAPAEAPAPAATTAGTLPPQTPVTGTAVRDEAPATMIPARARRSAVESFFVRIIATFGIVAIGVVIAAIMGSQHVHGWIIGLVVALVTVVLSAVLWSSQRL